ncbi:MAG: lysine--tRNA ligase [Nitrospirales bacterium]|nr:lysine--tRNA ligase [Nitrospirales bacterium]MBA3967800.1 lysine--tRNA ligase [Nitrospirales bacterium]
MEELNEQQQQRLEKLHALQDGGLRPFGTRFPTTHTLETILQSYTNSTKEELEGTPISCTVAGRIVAMRRFGKAAFAALQEEGHRLQVYLKKDLLGDQSYELSQSFDLGDWIGVEGKLFRTKTDELTVEVHTLTFLTKGLRPLPEKWHGLTDIETRYRQRYVDLIANPSVHQVFRTRSRIINIIRSFLTEREYLEVETPMMHSIPGGATARPFVTHHNTLDVDLYLRVAPELYLKRLMVGGFRRVFEINRNFRNEGISTIHNPEFTMLEFYQAYADFNDLMDLTEQLFHTLSLEICGGPTVDYQGQSISLAPPWRRVPYLDSIIEVNQLDPEVLSDHKKAVDAAERLGVDCAPQASHVDILVTLFEATVEPTLTQPTFITDFPIEISPLARKKESNPALTDRFELFIGGRELANGFSELNDPLDQRQRFEAQVALRDAGDDEAHYLDEDFIRALEYGMPPTAGEGIGIDRLVMLLTNQASIRDVILFPQLRPDRPL